jgi:rRNA maturation endonuclease Nob1
VKAAKQQRVDWSHARIKGRLPPRLIRCPGCGQYIYPQGKTCVHCGGQLVVLRRKQLAAIEKAQKALSKLQEIFGPPD